MGVKKNPEGGYWCTTCGQGWVYISDAESCCHAASEGAYALPNVIKEINPSGIVDPGGAIELSDEEPTITYADTVPRAEAPELLGRAAKHMHDRASTYDRPDGERSMGRTVQAFNAITGRNLSESEGWLLMTLLKSVRGFTREAYHADSFEDLIAYAALCAEAKSKGL